MPKQTLQPPARESLREELETLPGVDRAIVEGPPLRLDLICDPAAAESPVEAAVHALLARRGVQAEEAELRFSYRAALPPRRRVRFLELAVGLPRAGQVEATVRLEWEGEQFVGHADGEGGGAGELRVCALAAMRAVEAVVGSAVTFSLVGIKATRIFDHDLVAVLLQSDDVPDRRLIGVALVTANTHRSAALAVLNATNRLLGNYLSTAAD